MLPCTGHSTEDKIKNLSLRPIVNYGIESLALINIMEKVLMTCERKILDHQVNLLKPTGYVMHQQV